MALARVQYESDGSTTEYSIPFPYINRDDIKVSIDGTETEDWSFLDGSTVKLDSAPPQGDIIDVVRETEREDLLVEFNDGSTLLESDLTLAAQQSFFIAQEAFDQTGATLAVAEDGSYSANDRRISLLGYPTKSDDASNKQYVDDTYADGYNAHDERVLAEEARQAAEAAESAAATSESNAATSETNAADSESAAATSEANAATSETNAADSADEASTYLSQVESDAQAASDSADAAATSETNAENSATAAASSETDAETAATNAQNSEDAAATSETNAATSESNAQTYRDQAQGYASDAETSASDAATSESNAATSEANASDSETAAQNWAITAEDTLVPEGDGTDDYSALHWARKAEGWASSLNMPSASGNAGRIIQQKDDESGFKYVDKPVSMAGPLNAVTHSASGSLDITLDVDSARHVDVDLQADVTDISVSTPFQSDSFILTFTQDSTGDHAVTWMSSALWPFGEELEVSSGADQKDVFQLWTVDGGTTWHINLVGADYS